MAKKKEKEEKEVFYVGVTDPAELRRDVLESIKDIITILKTYENFKSVREEKAKQTLKLKDLVAQITLLINKLKRELPKTRIRAKPEKEIKAIERKEEVKMVQVPRKKMSEIEKLEAELTDIEKKLSLL
ncbi:hypothetical protein KY325_04240 [Candidatus Woesearchaeota archaeon]|nr:hypothetical protein [Candidatus Woesearchaeota archaeon]MBW3018345.1 hypothetical protein [Candidatus Woesearchaeota archaeon]